MKAASGGDCDLPSPGTSFWTRAATRTRDAKACSRRPSTRSGGVVGRCHGGNRRVGEAGTLPLPPPPLPPPPLPPLTATCKSPVVKLRCAVAARVAVAGVAGVAGVDQGVAGVAGVAGVVV